MLHQASRGTLEICHPRSAGNLGSGSVANLGALSRNFRFLESGTAFRVQKADIDKRALFCTRTGGGWGVAQGVCAAAAELWVNRYSTFSQGIVMARPSRDGIHYWLSRNESVTRWWRANLAAVSRALCEATHAAGFGPHWWPSAVAAAAAATAPGGGSGAAGGRVVVVVSKARDADRRGLMRVKLGAAGVRGYRGVEGVECRAHRPCAQQLAALGRAVRQETKTNFTQVRPPAAPRAETG